MKPALGNWWKRPEAARRLLAVVAYIGAFGCGEPSDRQRADPPPASDDDSLRAAVVSVLAGFDDEGIRERDLVSPSSPGPYISHDTVFADIAMLTPLFPPELSVAVAGSTLIVGGVESDLVFRRHGDALYVPVKEFASRFRAYTRVHDNHATVWPHERLCEYLRRNPDQRAPVFQEAQAEGLFAACN